MIQWIFIFLISLILFLLLIDWNALYSNIWFGAICMVHYLGIDIINSKLGYWHYLKADDSFTKLFIFSDTINIFYICTVFFMGTLFVQFLPQNYFLQLLHAFAWTIFFRVMFQIAEHASMIEFIHWRAWMYFYIIPVNMLALAWLKNIFNERKDRDEDNAGNNI